jgi:hypothetical protein
LITVTNRQSWTCLAALGFVGTPTIAVFDAKYHYDFWRPVIAIRDADLNDNPGSSHSQARPHRA